MLLLVLKVLVLSILKKKKKKELRGVFCQFQLFPFFPFSKAFLITNGTQDYRCIDEYYTPSTQLIQSAKCFQIHSPGGKERKYVSVSSATVFSKQPYLASRKIWPVASGKAIINERRQRARSQSILPPFSLLPDTSSKEPLSFHSCRSLQMFLPSDAPAPHTARASILCGQQPF